MAAYFVAIAIFSAIYLLLALGLNLQYGLTGLANFGHVGFFCVGAYAAALLALHGAPPILGFIAAAVLSAVLALPLGLVSVKLRGDYFAIVTLGFSEVVRIVATSEQWLTHGVQGIAGVSRLMPYLGNGMLQASAVLCLLITVNLVAIFLMRRIAVSPFGRVLEAIRDNEPAVKALGKDPAWFKNKVLMLGAGLAGIAGAFYAHYIGYVSPDEFVPLITFQIWMAIIMGGVGRVSGAVSGTLLLMLFLEGSRFLRDVIPFVADVQMANLRLGAVGLALILFILYRPQGLMGDFTRR